MFSFLVRRLLISASVNLSLLAGLLGFFIVNQTEQVLVLEFGELKRVINKPGPYWRIPLIQKTVQYEKRVLNCDISEIELTLGDQKRIIVSIFARYFIKDPILFYKTVQNEEGAKNRLDVIINGDLRNMLGQYTLQDLLSNKRDEVESRLSEQVRESMLSMGMDIVEIKLKTVLFPEHNRQAVFERMKSERLREAQEWRGKAARSSSEIRAKADVKAAEVAAKARASYKQIVGAADAKSIKIRNDAYSKNREFGNLYTHLLSYNKLQPKSVFLRTDHTFLRYMGTEPMSETGKAK